MDMESESGGKTSLWFWAQKRAASENCFILLMHRMDIACAPYPAGGSDYFSPLKVYEYLAAGVPVIASAVGQLPSALDHGRLGRLVPPGDAAVLTEEKVATVPVN